jgi:tetratricopeptide (TPR) repeat protein/transcriptional regulator with XRE-family HTH domain
MTVEGAEFGARLRACRRSAGLSQEELAERSGLSLRAISNLERGRTRWPYPDTVHRLADALGLSTQARAAFAAAAGRRLTDADAVAVAVAVIPAPADEPGQAGRGAIVPRQLPGPVRQFAGRQHEMAALAGMLGTGGSAPAAIAISAIGGSAGVGKTALAVHWAHQIAAEFPDGQLYVNLRGYDVGQPMPTSEALAGFLRALGLTDQGIPGNTDERAAVYRSLLSGRRVLVVLDNALGAEQVRPLLPGSPTCLTVVTSRDALAGLVVRDGAVRLDVDLLPLPEATGLLRALIGDRVEADPEAAVTLATQCCRLPLALRIAAELAVARPGVPLSDLTAELADLRHRLDVLDTSGDDRTAVRTVFAWSYGTLSADAARLFRLAGLHPGPDLDGYAAAALTRTSPAHAGRLLDQLTSASLMQRAAPGRYSMHDLLRAYAHELTAGDSADERQAALTALVDYYLHTAATAMDTAFPAERSRRPAVSSGSVRPAFSHEAAALAWLATERPNLVAVTVHAAEHGWPDHAARLSATLYRYLDTECLYPEAVTIHSHARRAAQRTGDQQAEANALNSLGVIDLRQGRYRHAADYFEQALALFRATGDRLGETRARANLGFVEFLKGRIRQASEHMQQSLALFRELGDEVGEARMLTSLGFVDMRLGAYEQAAEHLHRSLALCRDIGDQGALARALGALGEVYLRQGRYQAATSQVGQALDLFHAIGDQISEADTLASLAVIELRQGLHREAAGHLEQARAICQQTRDLSSHANTLNSLGELLLATGQAAGALGQYAAALDLAVQAGEKYEQARAHAGLASGYQRGGEPRAQQHWREALNLYAELDAPEAGQVRAQLDGSGEPDGLLSRDGVGGG